MHRAQIVVANETAAFFTCENNQPLAAIVANGGVDLLRAEIDQRLEAAQSAFCPEPNKAITGATSAVRGAPDRSRAWA